MLQNIFYMCKGLSAHAPSQTRTQNFVQWALAIPALPLIPCVLVFFSFVSWDFSSSVPVFCYVQGARFQNFFHAQLN